MFIHFPGFERLSLAKNTNEAFFGPKEVFNDLQANSHVLDSYQEM